MDMEHSRPWIEDILPAAGLPTPMEPGHHIQSESGSLVANKDRSGLGGFDLVVPEECVHTVTTSLYEAGASPMGHTALEALRIGNGRARWPTDGNEKSFVHELAINEEVCNFNKGCYLGQEIINRIDVKGQVNKRLTRIVVHDASAVPIGSGVLLGEKQVGTVSVLRLPMGNPSHGDPAKGRMGPRNGG